MNAKVTIDSAGRLVLPKPMRDALRIGPGDTLDVESDDDRLVLSPVRVRPELQKKQGIWTYRSGSPANAAIPDLIDSARKRRIEDLLGNKG